MEKYSTEIVAEQMLFRSAKTWRSTAFRSAANAQCGRPSGAFPLLIQPSPLTGAFLMRAALQKSLCTSAVVSPLLHCLSEAGEHDEPEL